ncbi:DUF6214 family protein [Streptomyces flavofungini]|uniref:DUF6214 family protein n=1 Tax=Streptomyces flavofungini TaxID=68200 RepID=UPI0025AF7A6A|nr:DUF6214 family protein [Streptomyces flavofungini]WJV44368.1 DUF6214 family protein [Streptomyces flavofungini]
MGWVRDLDEGWPGAGTGFGGDAGVDSGAGADLGVDAAGCVEVSVAVGAGQPAGAGGEFASSLGRGGDCGAAGDEPGPSAEGAGVRDGVPPSLFHVRLAFGGDGGGAGEGGGAERGGFGGESADGGCCRGAPRGADVLAVVSDGRIAIEEVRACPPLPLDDLMALAARIEGPLHDAFRGLVDRHGTADALCRGGGSAQEPPGARRGRPSARRGNAVRNVAAEAYRGALDDGEDPVLAVMRATGRSRRKSLRLIAGARDAGLLVSRHHRR